MFWSESSAKGSNSWWIHQASGSDSTWGPFQVPSVVCLTSGTQSPYRDGDTKGKIGERCQGMHTAHCTEHIALWTTLKNKSSHLVLWSKLTLAIVGKAGLKVLEFSCNKSMIGAYCVAIAKCLNNFAIPRLYKCHWLALKRNSHFHIWQCDWLCFQKAWSVEMLKYFFASKTSSPFDYTWTFFAIFKRPWKRVLYQRLHVQQAKVPCHWHGLWVIILWVLV